MEKERNNVTVSIFLILIIFLITATFIGYIGYNNIVDNYETKLEQQKQEFENENTVNKEEVQEKIVEKGVFIPFDLNKNTDKDAEYKIGVNSRDVLDGNIAVNLTNEGKVEMYFDGYGENSLELLEQADLGVEFKVKVENDTKTYEVTGFNKKVVDVFAGIEGNGISYPIVLFLMEDGTVEYLNLKDALVNENFVSSGKIENLNNIVRFEQCGLSYSDFPGGGYCVIAINNEGYFTLIDGEELNK